MAWADLGIEAIACTVVIAGFILLCIAIHHGERAVKWALRAGSASGKTRVVRRTAWPIADNQSGSGVLHSFTSRRRSERSREARGDEANAASLPLGGGHAFEGARSWHRATAEQNSDA